MNLVLELDGVSSGEDVLPEEDAEIAALADLVAEAEGDDKDRAYMLLESRLLQLSPSRMAMKTSGGAWLPYRHLVLLNRKLRELAARKIKRLIVTMPPRHGKSWTCSKHFPAWYLSQFPDDRIILTSYEATFASSWGAEVRDLIEQNNELLGISVRQNSKAKDWWNLVGRRGGMTTAGMGGPITGKGANLLIIDDPVKNAEEANSEIIQENNWNWYLSTAHTRLEPGGVILLVLTRWNEADLGGKVLDEHGDEWEVLNLPAIAEDDDQLGRERGEALCPQRYDLEALQKIRKTSTAHVWAALYQQRPTTEGGGRFKAQHFRYWTSEEADRVYYRLRNGDGSPDDVVARSDCFRFSTMDTAGTTKKRSDYTVISTWDVAPLEPTRLILVARLRMRVETTAHLTLIGEVFKHLNPSWMGIDSNALGLATYQAAARHGYRVRELAEGRRRDKEQNAEIAQVVLEQGRVYFPRDVDWLEEWEHELLMFPHGAHDDQVDTFSAAAIEMDRRRSKKRESKVLTFREQVLRRNKKNPRHPILGAV